jgi:glyoxylase-like metal-dependent hydrolase (beta-lactamase superfamily II)
VLAGAQDLRLVGDPERIIGERYARFAVHDDVPFGDDAAERARARAGAAFAGAEAAYPEITVELGGRTAAVVPTPGHSAGHVSAWIAGDGVLAAGDAIMGAGIPTRAGTLMIPPMYAPPAAYRETIERVRALGVRIFASGHEPILRDGEIDAFLDVSKEASDRIAVLVASALGESPRTLLEICARVHAAYGGLPADGAAALALTVDGHLDELIAGELAVIASDNPRRFRSLA